MTTMQILWGLNSFLITILFFSVRIWIVSLNKALEKMEKRIDMKLDAALCLERHGEIQKGCAAFYRHKHAPSGPNGFGGEVIML